MEKQLSKKLYAFIVTVMMFSASAHAQIVYTDVNPDTVISSPVSPIPKDYNLDLNNDGVDDYKISSALIGSVCANSSRIYTRYVKVSVLNANAVVAKANSTHSQPMNLNDSIIAGQPFSTLGYLLYIKSASQVCGGITQLGYWPQSNDRYLGLKLIVGANTYYGWARIRISLGTPTTCTIKDYAYNSIPNQPILAGETSCTTPTVTLSKSGSLSFCNGDSVTLTANGTGYLYQWKKNNVNIAGETAKTYVAKTAGIYKCRVTNSCGSKGSGTKTVTVPCRNTEDNIVETLEQLSVYPNPATNAVTINFPTDEAGEIQVVNLFGQVVYSEKINAAQTQIDVSNFATGMYVIRWNSGENFETKSFSVTK